MEAQQVLPNIQIRDDELLSLNDFAESWRWTHPNHDLLPPEALATIQPIRPLLAATVWSLEKMLLDNREETLSRQLFAIERRTATRTPQTAAWLIERLIPATERIIVSWGPTEAVLTTAATFAAYWMTFRYPASDDVAVWPRTQCWALLYHHAEEFHYGIWRLD